MSLPANTASSASALLVIDVQQGLFDTTPAPYQAAAVIARINALTARARQSAAPVIFIQHEQASDGLLADTPAWQLANGLDVQATDHAIRKTTGDAFLRTALEQLLQARNIQHLVICGYATEFCVDTSIRRAAALGYAITIAADAHTTHDKEHASGAQIRAHHNATLPAIGSFGVAIEAVDSSAIRFR